MENKRNLMTTTEAVRYLGVKPSYLYKMMRRQHLEQRHNALANELRDHKPEIGRAYLFPRSLRLWFSPM